MYKKILKVLIIVLLLMPFVNVNAVSYSSFNCGGIERIPSKIADLTRIAVIIIQIVVPILLVIFGMLDLMKGVTAQKEDEIKKGQQILIKRCITAVIIFFVIVIVKLLVSLVADSESDSKNIIECFNCFLVEKCKPN